MKFKTLLTINAVLAIATGIACVLVPDAMLSNYEVTLPRMGLVIYQFWGTTLIGLGMLAWFTRNIKDSGLQRAIALSLLITNALSCLMAIRGQDAGANASGWSTVAFFLFLTLGFGSFVLKQWRAQSNQTGITESQTL